MACRQFPSKAKAACAAVVCALALAFAPDAAFAAGMPKRIAAMADKLEDGVWSVDQPGCFRPFFFCYTNQTTYIEGEQPRFPIPLKPEYAAEFKKIQDALKDGVSLFDPDALCHPAGIPAKLRQSFRLSFQAKRIYILFGGSLEYRTIYMDGRTAPALDPVQYTYNGYSTGHWEGDTLVVETRNLRGPDTQIMPHIPKSERFWIVERYRPVSADVIDYQVTMMDEIRFTGPYTEKYQFKRDPTAELQEQTACIAGDGQRYVADPATGSIDLTGPGGAPLEKAED